MIFLKSKKPEGLIRLQLINNKLNGIQYAYTTPVFDGKDWLIWFFADVSEWKSPNKVTKDGLKFMGLGDE